MGDLNDQNFVSQTAFSHNFSNPGKHEHVHAVLVIAGLCRVCGGLVVGVWGVGVGVVVGRQVTHTSTIQDV